MSRDAILLVASSGHHETHAAKIVNRAECMTAVSTELLGDRSGVLHARARDLSDRRGYDLDGGTKHRPIRGEQEMELLDIGMLRLIGGYQPATETLERGFRANEARHRWLYRYTGWRTIASSVPRAPGRHRLGDDPLTR